jgi:hemerythrin-like domain-containing protein
MLSYSCSSNTWVCDWSSLTKTLPVLYISEIFLLCFSYALGCTFETLNSRIKAWEANMPIQLDRRNALRLVAVLGTGALTLKSGEAKAVAPFFGEVETRESVSPVEDLTRQHGILRRIVNVYAEIERRVKLGESDINAAAIADAATLFRVFGEEWHERVLEEENVFAAVRKAGGETERLVNVLLSQHQRGREITNYLITSGTHRAASEPEPLADALGSMARMYNAHAAFEDTVIFPAWSASLSRDDLQATASHFREMELQAFGKGWFEEAIVRVKHIEQALRIPDLDVYTAPLPRAA